MKEKKNVGMILTVLLVIALSSSIAFADETIKKGGNENNSSNEIQSVSKALSYDEIVTELAEDEEISYQEAAKLIGSQDANLKSGNATYRTFTTTVTVTSSYKPSLKFYCRTSENGDSYSIVSINNVTLMLSYNGLVKQYDGYIKAWLRSSSSIEYNLNGDFYNNGTTTRTSVTSGGTGLNELFRVDYSASMATISNLYSTCSKNNILSY